MRGCTSRSLMGFLDEGVQHLFCRIEVGNHAVPHRLDRHHIPRGAPQHLFRVFSDALDLPRPFVRATMEGSSTTIPCQCEYQGVRGAQIDSQIGRKHA